MTVGAGHASEARRRHLTALAAEVGVRGLRHRLVGGDSPMLRVHDVRTGRSTTVVAMPSARMVWSFLWGGGGEAPAEDPAHAADLIVAFLRS